MEREITIIASGISLALALLISLLINSDVLAVLRTLRLTQQTSRTSIWNDVLYTLPRDVYVEVELQDGRLLLGYLKHYSPKPEESMLFLSDAYWISATARIPIDGPGILLTKASGIKNLMFLWGQTQEETASPIPKSPPDS